MLVQKTIVPGKATSPLPQPSPQSSAKYIQDTPAVGPAPRPTVSPQRGIRIDNALFSGPTGFFKDVYVRKASSAHTGSQSSNGGHTPQAFQTFADPSASPALEERASDGYASSAATGQELPPSSEGSRSGSADLQSHDASTASLPLTQPMKQEMPERPTSQGPPLTITTAPRLGENKTLGKTIATARIALAQQENAFIDLTLSDSDEELKPTTWSDPDDVVSTTRLLADIAPSIFAETPGNAPDLRVPSSYMF
ncbi:hypothetical protein PHLGIDRAFT_178513 [Phlebiopsis gigantea 11061_1 CR5-6]|uniref:Uncharacterized protein n=1 Tax=Phlebiopsis gigantea (strain 11061_1 CR5-6) TaxID=745531 RepID=A0A0C3S476_PHLG1|nr:hypothetical protein PHLGIDRAFT_178513 [Phlebiopsis gigantea 11061_1 CR5-6]